MLYSFLVHDVHGAAKGGAVFHGKLVLTSYLTGSNLQPLVIFLFVWIFRYGFHQCFLEVEAILYPHD